MRITAKQYRMIRNCLLQEAQEIANSAGFGNAPHITRANEYYDLIKIIQERMERAEQIEGANKRKPRRT